MINLTTRSKISWGIVILWICLWTLSFWVAGPIHEGTIGIQVTLMLLAGIIGSTFIQSSTKQSYKIIAALITFLIAGILFFTIPNLIPHVLYFFVPGRDEMGLGKAMIGVIINLLLISLTGASFITLESKNKLGTFITSFFLIIAALITLIFAFAKK